MRRIVLRGLATRRARTILSAFAVVLGVALVTGALTLGGALKAGAKNLSAAAYDGTDAVVSSPQRFHTENSGTKAPIPASTLARVRAVPGVGAAVGDILDEAKILDSHGKPLTGGPFFGGSYDSHTPGAARLSPFRLVRGAWAAGPHQVVIDQSTSTKQHLPVGSRVRIATAGPAQTFTVSGVARFGSVKTIGSATLAIFDVPTAQRLFGKAGAYDDVLVAARPGTDPAALRARLQRELGAGVGVQTAKAQDRFGIVNGLEGFLNFIQTFLVAFGGIAVLVGALTIANALSLTVAQRARELALLRAAGASRGQVLRSVVLEGGLIGAAGSVLGVAVGYGLAHGLYAMVTAFGLDLPTEGLHLAAGTVVAGLAVGMIATLGSSLSPALRATRVPPVAALREGAAAEAIDRHPRRSTVIGLLFALLGAGIVAYAMTAPHMTSGERLQATLPGFLALMVAIGKLGRHAVVPVASLLGRPSARFGGAAGELARRNAMRNPARTASTSRALMVGIALVTTIAVLGTGLKQAVDSQIRDNVRADHIVAGTDGYSPIPAGVVRAAQHVPGVRTATPIVTDEARAYGSSAGVAGVDPAQLGKVWKFRWHHGSPATLASLAGDGAIVRRDFATKHDLRPGSRFTVVSANGRRLALTVRGVVDGTPIDPLGLGQVMVARPAYESTFTTRKPKLVLVAGGGDAALRRAVAPFADAKVQAPAAFAHDVAHQIDPVIGLVTVLLALAVLISVLGIVNTLALAVHERTRELGLLRSVGMSRRQVRRLVRHEGALTALVGAVLGIAVGLGLAGVVTACLASEGLQFALPVGSIAAYAVVSALAGVLAAALPARRAARLPVLSALAQD